MAPFKTVNSVTPTIFIPFIRILCSIFNLNFSNQTQSKFENFFKANDRLLLSITKSINIFNVHYAILSSQVMWIKLSFYFLCQFCADYNVCCNVLRITHIPEYLIFFKSNFFLIQKYIFINALEYYSSVIFSSFPKRLLKTALLIQTY